MSTEGMTAGAVQRSLGMFGLVLIIILSWAGRETGREARGVGALWRRPLAALAIGFVTAVGRIADRMPAGLLARRHRQAPGRVASLAQPHRIP